jgi:hypothetical protein
MRRMKYIIEIDTNEKRIGIRRDGVAGMEMTPWELIRIACAYHDGNWNNVWQECEWALI